MKTVGISCVKGGVGKTLIALNIARTLKDKGVKVGLIDCDWDNPNFAQFTRVQNEIEVSDKRFRPFDWDGIQTFSMSLIAGREKGICQTEDRYSQMLDDVVRCSDWDSEYFVVDLPSGSGSIFSSAMEIFGESTVGNVIVTQPLMVDATKRTLNLHKHLEIPVLGLIENMSYFQVGDEVYYPFGKSSVEGLAQQFDTEVLGKIPLSTEIAEGVANGDPIIKGSEVIGSIAQKVIDTPTQKIPLVERLKGTLDLKRVKALMERVLAELILSIKRGFDIGRVRKEKGFTEKLPFLLVITDESGTKEITRVALRVEEDGVKVIKKPKVVDFEVASDFHTLARMVMGKKRIGDMEVTVDPIDFWLTGDCKVYGRGFAPRAVDVIKNIFRDETLMSNVREQYGKILQGWL